MLATRRSDRIHRPVITAAQVRAVMSGFPGVVEYWFPDDLNLDNMAAVASWAGGKSVATWAQGTGSAQPWMRRDGIRARPAIEFGGDDFLNIGSAALAGSFDGDDRPCLAVMVTMPRLTSTIQGLIAPSVRTASATGYTAPIYTDGSSRWQTRRRGNAESIVSVTTSVVSAKEAPAVVVANQKGTLTDVWVNQTKVVANGAQDSVTIGTGNDSSLGGLYNNGTLAHPYTGLIAATLVATTGMTDTDIAELIRVLMLYYRLGG